jgi:hypothetical protein
MKVWVIESGDIVHGDYVQAVLPGDIDLATLAEAMRREMREYQRCYGGDPDEDTWRTVNHTGGGSHEVYLRAGGARVYARQFTVGVSR